MRDVYKIMKLNKHEVELEEKEFTKRGVRVERLLENLIF